MTDADDALALLPEDLDGHTLDELVDYLERDRRPPDPSIDGSPACLIALAALERLRARAAAYFDGLTETDADDSWITTVLSTIPFDARAGRDLPIPLDLPGVEATVTEGALRGLVRRLGDAVPGLLIGAVGIRLPEVDGESGELHLQVAIVYGVPIAGAVKELRVRLAEGIAAHFPFPVATPSIRVVDVILPKRRAVDE